MNTVLTFLEASRKRLALERYGISGRMSCLVVTPRFRASSHVVFLVLNEGKPDPLLVAKVPRLAGASASIEREVANLCAVQSTHVGGLDSIPKVVTFEEYCGYKMLVETALVGQPMDPGTIRRDLIGCCDAVTAWLIDIQRPQPDVTEGSTGWFERLVEEPLHHFAEVFPLSSEEERLLECTWSLVAPLRGTNLPLVFEHGDLSHPNILLLENGGIGVVDWELAEPCGLPAYDLFFFLTYAAFALHNARANGEYVSAFHAAFFGRAAWARPYVRAYAEQLQLPLHLLSPLFVLCWTRYMSSLLFRLGDARCTQGRLAPNTAAWLRANRYYALWRYALAHANELDWHGLPRTKAWGT